MIQPLTNCCLAPALLAGLALAACNPTASTPPAATAAAAPPPSAAPGGGCAAEIARFKSILDYDLSIGRVAQSVHGRATADLRQAEEACRAGRAVQARSILVTTKRNYGYG